MYAKHSRVGRLHMNLEGWRTGRRPWGVGNDGRIRNLLPKTQCSGSDISQRKRKFIFPAADGRITLSGRYQELRTSTLIRNHPIRGESRRWIAWLAAGIQREFGWWKYFNRTLGKPRARKSRHFQVISMNFQWSREQKRNRVRGKDSVYTHFPKDPELRCLLVDENNKGFLQKTRWRSHAQSGNFCRLDYWRSQSSKWRKWIAEQSSICRGGTRLGNTVVTVLPVQNRNCPGDPEEPNEVPGADKETKSHLHWQFLGIWQVLSGIILESMYVRMSATTSRVFWRKQSSSTSEQTNASKSESAIRSEDYDYVVDRKTGWNWCKEQHGNLPHTSSSSSSSWQNSSWQNWNSWWWHSSLPDEGQWVTFFFQHAFSGWWKVVPTTWREVYTEYYTRSVQNEQHSLLTSTNMKCVLVASSLTAQHCSVIIVRMKRVSHPVSHVISLPVSTTTSELPVHGQHDLLQGDTVHRAPLPEPTKSTSSAKEPL